MHPCLTPLATLNQSVVPATVVTTDCCFTYSFRNKSIMCNGREAVPIPTRVIPTTRPIMRTVVPIRVDVKSIYKALNYILMSNNLPGKFDSCNTGKTSSWIKTKTFLSSRVRLSLWITSRCNQPSVKVKLQCC